MNKRLKADLALTLCSLIWGATFVVVKEALADASVFVFIAVRFALAAVLMGFIYGARLRDVRRETVWISVLIGLLMFSGYAFQIVGLQYTTPSKAAFITGSGVVLVPLLMALFWGRRMNAWVWAGAGATLVGLYYLTLPVGAVEGSRLAALNRGDLLVLVAALLFALHIIFVGQATHHHSVAALSFLQVAFTAVMGAGAVPLFAATGWQTPRLSWSAYLIFAIAITAVGATALAFTIQVWAQRYATPTHTAILFSLEPVFAGLTSYIALGERLGARGLLGAGLILAGIFIAELRGPTQAAVESAAPGTEAPSPDSAANWN